MQLYTAGVINVCGCSYALFQDILSLNSLCFRGPQIVCDRISVLGVSAAENETDNQYLTLSSVEFWDVLTVCLFTEMILG